MKKSIIVGLIFAAIMLGIVLGVIVHLYNDENVAKVDENQSEILKQANNNKTVIQTSENEVKTSPGAIITLETYYNKCGHSVIEKQKINNSEVNKTEEYFKDKYQGWKIKKFTTSEIDLYKEENKMCDKHYIIKENDGYVTVYNIDENGNETLKLKTDTLTKYLPQGDRDLLSKGIKANGDLELQQKLGDFE